MQCRLLITFAKSLVPDLGRQNVGPGLASNCLSLSNGIPEIFFFKKLTLKQKSADDKKAFKLPGVQSVKTTFSVLYRSEKYLLRSNH